MFADRTVYEFELVTATPTHVGTGEFAEMTRQGSNEPGHFAVIVRDADDKPYLPSTALKGILRRLAEANGEAKTPGFKALFGAIKAKKSASDPGNMGLLLMGPGRMTGGKPDCSVMPYAGQIKEKDAFIAARTAIDPKIGVADDHKLFFQEMIPAGTGFSVEATVLQHGKDAAEALELMDKLAGLMLRDGLRIGKGQADGQGHLKVLHGKASAIDHTLQADGELKPGSMRTFEVAQGAQSAGADCVIWHANCRGPFLVADSSVSAGRGRRNPDAETARSGPQIRAQRISENLPLLLGSTVSGALRARATWLANRAQARTAKNMAAKDEQISDADRAVVELFGTDKRRALVEIRELSVLAAKPENLTSVRIDRFSGGPVDNALFTAALFSGVELRLEIALVNRGGLPGEDAKTLFQLLCKDAVANGLMLGAGANKGFGWFTIRAEKCHGA